MTDNKLVSSGVHVTQGRGTALGQLRWPGPRSWKREATFLVAILMGLTAGYFTVSHFASQAAQDLADRCTARFEIELENADIDSSQEPCLGHCVNVWRIRSSTKTALRGWRWSTGACLIRWLLSQ